jgi:hypothetical protein
LALPVQPPAPVDTAAVVHALAIAKSVAPREPSGRPPGKASWSPAW